MTEQHAATCRHCGAVINRHEGIGGVQWRDFSPHSPSTCFKARNLTHDPAPPSGQGAGEQEPKGTRHEAGTETSGQPQAMRADALTPRSFAEELCGDIHPRVLAEQVFGSCDQCKRYVLAVLESGWLADQRRQAALTGRRITLDPGAFSKRDREPDGDYERLDQWQARGLDSAFPPAPTP